MIGAVLDTDVFSVLVGDRSETEKFTALLDGVDTALAFPSVAELTHGARRARRGRARMDRLESEIARHGLLMPTEDLLRLCNGLRAVAARLGHLLGHKVHGNDLWIAACAVYYGLPLVTGNGRHFVGLPGLEVLG